MLELGSGNGYLGLHHLANVLPTGSTLYLTDLEEVVPLLSENLLAARSTHPRLKQEKEEVTIRVRALPWGSRAHIEELIGVGGVASSQRGSAVSISHIVCSDLVYFPFLFEPLLLTLIWLTEEDVRQRNEAPYSHKKPIEIILSCECPLPVLDIRCGRKGRLQVDAAML